MKLVDVDEAYKVLTDYYHHRTETQHEALKEALERVPIIDVDSLNTAHEDIGYEKGYRDGYAEALEVADNTEHIRHGHWEWNDYGGFGNYHCTVCKYIPYGKFSRKFSPDYMYCPRCGAKMDEVSE